MTIEKFIIKLEREFQERGLRFEFHKVEIDEQDDCDYEVLVRNENFTKALFAVDLKNGMAYNFKIIDLSFIELVNLVNFIKKVLEDEYDN